MGLGSRDVTADSVEFSMRGHSYDARVAVAGCDKSLPGMTMAMLRLSIPSALVFGGSILPGVWRGRDVTARANAVVLDIVPRGRARGAGCLIFGCTEIGLLLRPEDVPLWWWTA
jgi:dihydroxyacid dehydratase/phosphogluconate dehydratase